MTIMKPDILYIREDFPININFSTVMALMGYHREKTVMGEDFKNKVMEIINRGISLSKPRGAYIMRKIKKKGDIITFYNTPLKIKSKNIEKLLSDAVFTVFIGVTIGKKLEEAVDKFARNNQQEVSVILDTVGSEAAESLAELLNNYIEIWARQNKFSITMRYSPGYGDLPVSFQKSMEKELELDKIGVQVTEKFMLLPQKSITALIGIKR